MGTWNRSIVSSMAIVFCCLILDQTTVEARQTMPRHKPFQLALDSIHTASFVFVILFGTFSLLQVLAALGKLSFRGGSKRLTAPSNKRGQDYFTGSLYFFLLLCATLALFTYYILSAITIVYTYNKVEMFRKSLSPSFVAGHTAVLLLTHWFICFAMLVLIIHRQKLRLSQKQLMRVESTTTRMKRRLAYMYAKLGLDALLLSALLGVIIAYTSLQTTSNVDGRKRTLVRLDHAYITLHTLVTFDVVFSGYWTWHWIKKSLPDLLVIGEVAKYISPLLVLQTAYRIAQHAIQYSSLMHTHQSRITNALFLSQIIITATTNFLILWFAL